MSLLLYLLRRRFGLQVEHYDDNNDHISTTRPVEESSVRNLVRDHVPARTSPSNVGYSPHFQKSSGRTNDSYENSRRSSPLQLTFSHTPFPSSSKPSQISYNQSLRSSKYTTLLSNPSQIFSTPSPRPSKSTTSLPSSSLLSPSSSSFKLPSPLQPLFFSYTAVQSSSKPPQISSSLLPPSLSSFKLPSELQPLFFSYTAVQSSSKPSQISSSQSLQSFEYTTPSSKPSQIFSTALPPPSKSTTSSSKPSSSLLSPSSSSPKLLTPTSKPSASSSTAPKSSTTLPPSSFSPSPLRTPPSIAPSKSSASSSNAPKSSFTLPPSSFSPSPLRTTPPTSPSKSSVSYPSTHKSPTISLPPPYSKPPHSPPSLAPSSSKPRPSSPYPASSHKPSLASAKERPSSSLQSPALKQFLCIVPSDATNTESKTSYVSAKAASPIYAIPEDIKDLIKKDIVPQVLKRPLCPSSYKSYFAALLHAEEYYLEKWSNFQLKNVSLELHEASIDKRSNKFKNYNQNVKKDDRDDTTFVVFEIDSVPAKRPFLLSRDLVFVQPLDEEDEPFQGLIHRVVKSTRVLVEFGDDFHSQHCPTRKYNISFSFNRVCLKRAHQAIEDASDFLFQNFLFPECYFGKSILDPPDQFPAYHELDRDNFSVVRHILSLRGSALYLLRGPLSAKRDDWDKIVLSRTGEVISKAVLGAYKTSPENRILICAPVNSTCDVLTRSLNKEIHESEMFRANAAFRELWEVPSDILGSCRRQGECFACPSLQKLLGFRVVVSTFMSCFRLHNEGITAGHFSHIFLVDASSAPEPEVVVALANFVDSNTAVVVTGKPGNRPHWVRSDIGRKYGLSRSYFERCMNTSDMGLQTERNYIVI